MREFSINENIIEKVIDIKSKMPKIGGRKLHYMINQIMPGEIGRDKLFRLLSDRDMLVKRKRKYVVTTDSDHPFKKHPNLIKGMEITRLNQVWVSDITYLSVGAGHCYLSLITDVFSRRIVGYHVNNTLELTGTLEALNNALKLGSPEYHHSDRGSQYCSYAYTNKLKSKNTRISMTENGNCYDNALAERINGILKDEFNLNTNFTNIKQARKVVAEAIETYNKFRPHWGLNLKTPIEVYQNAA